MTLVSVIGDFYSSVAPIFYEFKDKIDTHIIIADDSKRDSKYAKRFKRGVDEFIRKKRLKIKNLFYSIDEDSFESLNKAKEFILKNSVGEIFLNTTDGLSSINTYFSLMFLPINGKIISYDIYENEFHLIDKHSLKRVKISKNIPIKEHFLLKGIKVIKTGDKEYAKRHKNDIYKLFYSYHKEYKAFKREITKKDKLPSRDKFPQLYKIFDNMNITNVGFGKEEVFQALTGDMFEYFVYLQVLDLGFDDIEIGVEIEYENVKNEFDLLVSKDNHVHIIECKHKGFSTLDLGNLIYKYAALKRIVDDESRAVIVSLVTKYKEFYLNRAFANNIALFGMDENLKQNLKEFLIEGKEDGTFYSRYIKKYRY